jgi:hypothetical protein
MAVRTKRGKLGTCILVNGPLLSYTKPDYISALRLQCQWTRAREKEDIKELGDRRRRRWVALSTRHVTPKRTLAVSEMIAIEVESCCNKRQS